MIVASLSQLNSPIQRRTSWLHKEIEKILRVKLIKDPKRYLLNINLEIELENKYGRLLFYLISAARTVYATKWKTKEIPEIEAWIRKATEYLEMDKLTQIMQKRSTEKFRKDWELFSLYLKENKGQNWEESLLF